MHQLRDRHFGEKAGGGGASRVRSAVPGPLRALPLPKFLYDHETFRILVVNDAAVLHYGYTRGDFMQMSLIDLRPPEERSAVFWLACVRPEPNDEARELCRHAAKKGGAIIDVDVTGPQLRPGRETVWNRRRDRRHGESPHAGPDSARFRRWTPSATWRARSGARLQQPSLGHPQLQRDARGRPQTRGPDARGPGGDLGRRGCALPL